ncbi:GLPGLI family protein [Flavobacterium sp.]
MIKTVLSALLFFMVLTVNAQAPGVSEPVQRFQGKADYVSKRIFKNGVEDVGVKSDDDAALKAAYEVALKAASETKYTLTFNKKEALFEKQQLLEQPKPKKDEVAVSIRFSGEGRKYINIRDEVKIVEDDIMGKEFLIVDKLETFQWTLIDETKKIGEYTCHKAELIIPVTDKEKQEYEDFLKKSETKVSLFPMKEPSEKKITAWYAPEIPVSLGPLNYWGLPGLILELSDGHVVMLCSKVILSTKETTKIKIPNIGKEVTQEEFDTIHKEKMDSIYER